MSSSPDWWKVYVGLEPHAKSQRQSLILAAVLRHKTIKGAADELELSRNAVEKVLKRIKQNAVRQGWSPEHDLITEIPEDYHLKGASTYYGIDTDKDSSTHGQWIKKAQWVKTQKDREDLIESLRLAVEDLCEPIKGLRDPVQPPTHTDDEIMCVYPIGDAHIGMYAWAQETGASFDVKIAERNLMGAVDGLVHAAPPSNRCMIINVGDFLHGDNKNNVTNKSGHALDVDTRYPKVLRVGIRVMRRMIDRALLKHKHVHVVCEVGNHDENSAMAIALCLEAMYERDPRVHIDTSPDKFHWHRFGQNLIGVTHGDTAKLNQLPAIMACDRKEDWGTTTYRYWYTGHIHHDTLKEFPGCKVETFRTLAPRDSWHHAQGYRSGQDMKCIVLHREFGEIYRHTFGIRQVYAGLGVKGE